ncbi:MAG: hypothetical protein LBH69_02970 [Methanomassiliicoccaceae archaeon]|jgi:hypothetical protein|nr:hypothetical protein [Methanomassiliicoccaceae archaeon]
MSNLSGDSGGTAHGLNAYADAAGKDTLPALDRTMISVAEWIRDSAGTFLGHVKMAVTTGARTMTLNLTDLGTGVEHHGSLISGERVEIRFMAAVLDVDRNELADRMNKELISNGFKIKKSMNIIELG